MSLSQHRNHAPSRSHPGPAVPGARLVELVIPVGNERDRLEPCIRSLIGRLAGEPDRPVRISIAEAASTDGTLAIAERLAREFPEVGVSHFTDPGLGRALRTVWENSTAPVLARLDLGVPLDPDAPRLCLAPLFAGACDVVIGSGASANGPAAGTSRGPSGRRRPRLLHRVAAPRVAGAGCGFTAVRAVALPGLLKLVHDDDWLLDDRIQGPARKAGLRLGRGRTRLG